MVKKNKKKKLKNDKSFFEKNLSLGDVKLFTGKTLRNTKKKLDNFILNYKKQKEIDKLNYEKKLKKEKKKRNFKRTTTFKERKIRKNKSRKIADTSTKKINYR